MWLVPAFASLISSRGVFEVVFQQCTHGGGRDKWSSFHTNVKEFQCLALQCDKTHTHKPWGLSRQKGQWAFHTAEEAEYPVLLCSRVAEALTSAAVRLGIQMLSSKAVEPMRLKRSEDIFVKESAELHFQLRASSGLQPRGRKYPELIPEFSEVILRSFVSHTLPQP